MVAYVPLEFRQVSGTRPFVRVLMNGKPFLMMVHANAKLYAMTTHANAASIGLVDLGKTSNYGISADGHVSTLGRTSAQLGSLVVGNSVVKGVKLAVFEIPQTPPTDGMLGMDWLRAQRVIVDFDAARLGVPVSPAESDREDQKLVARGYVAHPMTWDAAKKTFYVAGSVNGTPARIAVSTVGQDVVDSRFAARAGVALGPVVERNGGPKGALVDTRLVKRQLTIVIDRQQAAPAQPWSYDLDAYSSVASAPDGRDDVFLGADFMLANQAVIDFGTATLFLAQPPSAVGSSPGAAPTPSARPPSNRR